MAPVYEGKGRPARGPRAAGAAAAPAALFCPRPLAGQPPARSPPAPGLRAPPPGFRRLPAPPRRPLLCPENDQDPEFNRILFPGWKRRGVEGGAGARVGYCPKKRHWEGASGRRPTHDCAFYLFVINKGDAVYLSSCPPPPRPEDLPSGLSPFHSVLTTDSLSISLRSHPTLLYSSRASDWGVPWNRNVRG